MKVPQNQLSETIKKIRELCRRLDEIESKIESGILNTTILPDYIEERDRINILIEQILNTVAKR